MGLEAADRAARRGMRRPTGAGRTCADCGCHGAGRPGNLRDGPRARLWAAARRGTACALGASGSTWRARRFARGRHLVPVSRLRRASRARGWARAGAATPGLARSAASLAARCGGSRRRRSCTSRCASAPPRGRDARRRGGAGWGAVLALATYVVPAWRFGRGLLALTTVAWACSPVAARGAGAPAGRCGRVRAPALVVGEAEAVAERVRAAAQPPAAPGSRSDGARVERRRAGGRGALARGRAGGAGRQRGGGFGTLPRRPRGSCTSPGVPVVVTSEVWAWLDGRLPVGELSPAAFLHQPGFGAVHWAAVQPADAGARPRARWPCCSSGLAAAGAAGEGCSCCCSTGARCSSCRSGSGSSAAAFAGAQAAHDAAQRRGGRPGCSPSRTTRA